MFCHSHFSVLVSENPIELKKNAENCVVVVLNCYWSLHTYTCMIVECGNWLDNYFWCRGGAIVKTYFLFYAFSKFHLRAFVVAVDVVVIVFFPGGRFPQFNRMYIYTFIRAKTYPQTHTVCLNFLYLRTKDHTLINDDIYRFVFVLFNIRSGSIIFSFHTF